MFEEYLPYITQPNNFLIYPWVILFLVPLIPILWIILRINFVTFADEDPEVKKKRNFMRFVVFISRILICLAILIAIASPYIERETVIDGDPFLKILVDNSTSFTMFDSEQVRNMVTTLSGKIRTDIKYFGNNEQSPIGDALLASLQNNGNVLLISDGNANSGVDLGDVVLYAGKLNASINAISLEPKENDVSVSISGPSKTLEEVDSKFMIHLSRKGKIQDVKLRVEVDGKNIVEKITRDDILPITQKLGKGYHQITATIEAQGDYFSENNKFYKTVKVVKKPHALFLTKQESPLYTLLEQVYILDKVSQLPEKLDTYSAIIMNNLNIKEISENDIERITDYVSDGNGFLLVGGDNAFERGGYKDSKLESILPVYVAEPGKKEGDINIVMLIDVSGSQSQTLSISKAQALSIFGDLKPENKLAILAFNTQAIEIEPLSYISEKLNPTEKLKKLATGGGTMIGNGLFKALDILKAADGSKNVILISDGITQLPDVTFQTANLASKFGVKIYTVGIGPQTNDFVMNKIATLANGIYFRTDQSSRLKLLFGKPEEGEKKRFGVHVLDSNHFITQDLDPPNALINGYNIVVPKSTASQLLTTDVGDPVLTAWRYGLGRIVTLTTDDGTQFAGELLTEENSHVLTRATNWAIGDPDRKSETFVDVEDTQLHKPTKVTVKSQNPPHAEGVAFFKMGVDIYQATMIPQTLGFNQLVDAEFAVNYVEEYADLGVNPDLEKNIISSGGKMYQEENIDKIIEHVRTRSKRTLVKKSYIRDPFIIAAIIILLLEIAIRRLLKVQKG